jgi:hypothetical protein
MADEEIKRLQAVVADKEKELLDERARMQKEIDKLN